MLLLYPRKQALGKSKFFCSAGPRIRFVESSLQGPWKQRTILNPAYFKLESPLNLLSPITAVAFELWTTEPGYTFDSVLLGVGQEGLEAAAAYMRQTWQPRHKAEVGTLGEPAAVHPDVNV